MDPETSSVEPVATISRSSAIEMTTRRVAENVLGTLAEVRLNTVLEHIWEHIPEIP